jgi:CRP-like cAMP-binding protein
MSRSDAFIKASSGNHLLDAVPSREFKRIVPHLEHVSLTFRTVLHEPDQTISYLYFPTSGMLSLLSARDENGRGMEIAVVGREGVAGLPVLLGTGTMFAQSMVQVPGEALRIPANKFRALVSRDSKMHELLLRYIHVFLTQLAQGVACNALHPVEKRLCRWLLTVHDRATNSRFPVTHEFLASMLGVRRASVTEAARRLRQAGMIRYGGGQLTVLDRRGLERAVCGCYQVVRTAVNRMLSDS